MNGVYCLYFRLVLISLNTLKLVYISILKHIITVDRNYCLVFQIRHHHYQNRIKFSNYLFLFKIPLFLTNKREPSYSTSAPHSSSTKWIMYFHFSKNCNWILYRKLINAHQNDFNLYICWTRSLKEELVCLFSIISGLLTWLSVT